MSIGERILTLEQQENAIDVLIEIAAGHFINSHGNSQQLSRRGAIDKARTYLAAAGISWQKPPTTRNDANDDRPD